MSEKPRSRADFIRSEEEFDWTDLGSFAHEILVKTGETHSIENHDGLIDSAWRDPVTDDSMILRGMNMGLESDYMLEVVDGSQIGSRKRYEFSAVKKGIEVHDAPNSRLDEDEIDQIELQTYIMQRLETSRVPRPETNKEGEGEFWRLISRCAIDSVLNEASLQDFSRMKNSVHKDQAAEFMIDVVSKHKDYKLVPRRYIVGAFIARTSQLPRNTSQGQIEAKKED